MAPTALITGASGFIGRSLVSALQRRGWSVAGLARNQSVVPEGCEAICIDNLDRESLALRLSGRRFDVVFHLAAYGVHPSERDPATMFGVNVAGTAAVVEAAALCNARCVVYVGSCSEYQSPRHGRPIEEDDALTRTALYGAAKAAGGLWGSAAARRADIAFMWARLFGVFGPNERGHRLIPSLVNGLLRNERVALSQGDQMRDVLFIDDAVEGLIGLASSASLQASGAYNLCSGTPVTVRTIAGIVADKLGRSRDLLDFGAIPYRPDEPLWLVGRPDKLRTLTGFSPRFSLEDGIARTVAGMEAGARS